MRELLVGTHTVLEALRAGRRRVYEVWLRGAATSTARAVAELARARALPLRVLAPGDWRVAVPGGGGAVAAVCGPYPYVDEKELLAALAAVEEAWVVALDGVEDPQNLGAIVRTAEAAGARGLLLPKRRAAGVTPAVVRASAGASEWLPICRVANLVRALEALAAAGFWRVGLAQDGEEPWCEVDLRGRTVLVVGGEGRGLRRLVRQHCDHRVHLPLPGRVESLNASAAFAAVAYELVRQRRGRAVQAPSPAPES